MISLLAERAAFDELSLTTGGAGEDGGALLAVDDGGGVAVDGVDVGARGALDVHEVGVGALDETALLVLLAFSASSGVAEIGIEEAHDLRKRESFFLFLLFCDFLFRRKKENWI